MTTAQDTGDRSPFSSFRRKWLSNNKNNNNSNNNSNNNQILRGDFSRQEERRALTSSFLKKDSRSFGSRAVGTNGDFFKRHSPHTSRFTEIRQTKESRVIETSKLGESSIRRLDATDRFVHSLSTGPDGGQRGVDKIVRKTEATRTRSQEKHEFVRETGSVLREKSDVTIEDTVSKTGGKKCMNLRDTSVLRKKDSIETNTGKLEKETEDIKGETSERGTGEVKTGKLEKDADDVRGEALKRRTDVLKGDSFKRGTEPVTDDSFKKETETEEAKGEVFSKGKEQAETGASKQRTEQKEDVQRDKVNRETDEVKVQKESSILKEKLEFETDTASLTETKTLAMRRFERNELVTTEKADGSPLVTKRRLIQKLHESSSASSIVENPCSSKDSKTGQPEKQYDSKDVKTGPPELKGITDVPKSPKNPPVVPKKPPKSPVLLVNDAKVKAPDSQKLQRKEMLKDVEKIQENMDKAIGLPDR